MIAMEKRVPSRETLIDDYGHLCVRASKKFLRPGLDKADLQQIAAIGLIKACDRYDPRTSTPFEAFAWLFVVGELMHFVRDHERLVRAPRQLRRMEKQVQAAQDSLTAELGRDASTAEVAARLNVPCGAVQDVYTFRDRAVAESLDSMASHEYRISAPVDDPDTRMMIQSALRTLTAAERTVVVALYAGGFSQLELAGKLGYSRRHISRLHRRALRKMRVAVAW